MGQKSDQEVGRRNVFANVRLSPQQWGEVEEIKAYLERIGEVATMSSVADAIRYAVKLAGGMARKHRLMEQKHDRNEGTEN